MGQCATTAQRGERLQRHEVMSGWGPAVVGAGRLVGRGLRWHQWLGHQRRRGRENTGAQISATRRRCTTCWSRKSSLCFMNAPPMACRNADWRWFRQKCSLPAMPPRQGSFCYGFCKTCADFWGWRSYHEFFKEITWQYLLISSTNASLRQRRCGRLLPRQIPPAMVRRAPQVFSQQQRPVRQVL